MILRGARADQLSAVVYWYAFGYPLGQTMMRISSCFITVSVYQQSLSICVSGIAITISNGDILPATDGVNDGHNSSQLGTARCPGTTCYCHMLATEMH